MSEQVEVPADLAGERVDSALALLLGISRSSAALLCAEGNVLFNGTALAKADKLRAGTRLDVTIPVRRDPLAVVVEPVQDLKILLDDESFVVIDKPVGVAAHPSPGWVGPTVVGA
ncbi:MAG: RNA pseudouridine synthase, partial [Actinomycetota bacterium]|nr:RNA pseudouridine synthase [Actinomycetota bacterium]